MEKIYRYIGLMVLVVFGFCKSTAFANANNSSKGWKAGVSSAVITPTEPMWMAGYAARTGPSDGKLHDLWAKCLALEDKHGNQAVLITMDLLGMPKAMSDNIRNRLMEKHRLSKAQIILNSSHTHSGPVLQDALFDIYPLDAVQLEIIKQYSEWLENQIVDLVGNALQSMESARIFTENGVTRFQVNRRNNNESTLYQQTDLNGPNDYAVPVIKVEKDNGDLLAVAFGYACHPTVLTITKWSGDYPGFAQMEFERTHPGATALFFQGAGGNQNPMPRRTIALAKQFGRDLVSAVDRVLEEPMRELEPILKTAYKEVRLPLDPASLESLKDPAANPSSYEQRWAKRMLKEREAGKKPLESYDFPLQMWQLGDQLIATLGGETVVDYAIGLKRIFGYNTFVLGYSNDVMSYIPSAAIIREGGYEGDISQKVYGLSGKWKPTIEPMIYGGMMELADELGIEVPDKKYGDTKAYFSMTSLQAKRYYSGFPEAHDTYNAISAASDGNIYYVLSSASFDKGGQMYRYNPKTDKTEFLADLSEVCGEKDTKAIAQGKSHVRFFEHEGKLYFATHVGYYEMIDGMERLPVHAPNGFSLYPGGHFLSYDMADGKFEDLAIAPDGEGIITMAMDKSRDQLYGITWPKGYFIHYDLNAKKLYNLGKVSANGEAGAPGDDYRVLCRSMFVDDRDGLVYYSTSEGDVFFYDPGMASIQKMKSVNMRLDYFGKYDPAHPGNMGYNWRKIVWHPEEGVAYGVHGNSGYLFRFDPRKQKIEIVERITSEPSRKSGMFDYFSYGYLGFQLGPDRQTLYYLTGGPIYENGNRVMGKEEIAMGAARGLENLHLITYDIPNQKYLDHGPIFYSDGARPTYVNSIAVGPEGNVYTLARFEHEGKIIEDLVKIPNPFSIKNYNSYLKK